MADMPSHLRRESSRAEASRVRACSCWIASVPGSLKARLDCVSSTPVWTWRSGPGSGEVGVFYALVDIGQAGLSIVPESARAMAEAGIEIKSLLKDQVSVSHPEIDGLDEIANVMFRGRDPDATIRTCATLKPGRVDHSPCGTGSSANLAVLHAKGEVKVGDQRRLRSIIGGEFLAEAVGETHAGNCKAVLPRITGQDWICGREDLRIDANDSFPNGFAPSDSWGPQTKAPG